MHRQLKLYERPDFLQFIKRDDPFGLARRTAENSTNSKVVAKSRVKLAKMEDVKRDGHITTTMELNIATGGVGTVSKATTSAKASVSPQYEGYRTGFTLSKNKTLPTLL
jgi:hypothetical protein